MKTPADTKRQAFAIKNLSLLHYFGNCLVHFDAYSFHAHIVCSGFPLFNYFHHNSLDCIGRIFLAYSNPARVVIEDWRKEYNELIPHSAPGYAPPSTLLYASEESDRPTCPALRSGTLGAFGCCCLKEIN